MPEVEAWLHYRSVDVSTLKELCRRWYPEAFAQAPRKHSTHRALDDIKESIAELAYYRAAIFADPRSPGTPTAPPGPAGPPSSRSLPA
jgi:oligoribonuclease